MISTNMCCQWILLGLSAVLFLPVLHLASAGIVRHRGSSSSSLLDRRATSGGGGGGSRPHHHHHHQKSSPSSSSGSTPSSTSSFMPHNSPANANVVEDVFTTENGSENVSSSPSAMPSFLDESDIELPTGFKFVGLDEDNLPFIIIPNMKHILENNSELMSLLKTAMRDAHRNKRSPPPSSSSSSSSSQTNSCHFNYQVTVRRTGHCVRFGEFPACLSGDQLFPFAHDC